jgi:hypothetical protein
VRQHLDMFAAAGLRVISEVGLSAHVDFDIARCVEYARRVKPGIDVLLVCATRGDACRPGSIGCWEAPQCGRLLRGVRPTAPASATSAWRTLPGATAATRSWYPQIRHTAAPDASFVEYDQVEHTQLGARRRLKHGIAAL